jgi:hypothetical protein
VLVIGDTDGGLRGAVPALADALPGQTPGNVLQLPGTTP